MAKSPKNKKLELDEYGFDPSLDIPEFDFDMSPPKDDRKAITKASKGFLQGAKDTAMSPGYVARLLRKALPKGYGEIADLADDTAGSLKNLYNNSAQEMKPMLSELKRTTARAIPAAEKVLPKKITDKLRSWSKESQSLYQGLSPQAQREAAMNLQIADVLKFQSATDAQNRNEDFVRDKLKEGIEQARHRDSLSQLDAIRQSLSQMASYQSKVETNYQRKSLELQFRSYFAQVDILEEAKRQNAKTAEALAGILKNTGLPDSVKLRASERWADMTRNKFFDSLNEGVFAGRRNFVRNLGAKAAGAVKERLGTFMGSVRSGMDAANAGLDASEMMSQFGGGPSAAEFGGSVAGSIGADVAGSWLGKKLGKKLAKHQGIVRGGNRAQQTVENFPQMAGEWARSSKGETGVGVLDFLLGLGKDSVLSALSPGDRTLNLDRVQNMHEQSIYTRHANKSITEIIPGFLSRIYQELQIIRTGDAKTPLTVYDLTQNKFNGQRAAYKNAHKTLFSEGQRRGVRSQTDALLDQVDPQKTLSEEERKDLGKQLLSANLNNRYGSKDFFTSAGSFSGANGAKYAGLFDKHLSDDAVGHKELSLTRAFSGLGSGLADTRSHIQSQANAGLLDFLAHSGIVDPLTGGIDMEKVFAYQQDEDYQGPEGAAGGAARRMPKSRQHSMPAPGSSTPGSPATAPNMADEQKELFAGLHDTGTQQVKIGLTMSDTLMRIEQRLMEGIFTFNPQDPKASPGFMDGLKDQIKQRRKGWSLTMGDLRDAGLGLGKRGFNLARNILTGGLSGAVGSFKGVWNTVKALTPGVFGKIKDGLDVFVPGERTARLQASLLAAGEYFDQASGKVIKSLKDIKGAVVDKDGKVILTVEQARQAFVKTGLGRKALSTIARLGRLGGSAANFLTGGVAGMLHSGYGFLRDHQQAIGRGISKVAGFGRDMLGKGLSMASSAGSALFGGLTRLPGKVGQVFSKFVLPDGIVFAGGKTIVQRLTEIRDLLTARLPGGKHAGDSDGDGDRDGGYEDQMQKRASGGGAKAGSPGLFKGLFSRTKEDSEDDEDDDTATGGRRRRRKLGKAPKGLWGKAKWLGKAGLSAAGSLAGLGGLGSLTGAAGAVGGGLATAAGWLGTAAAATATGVGALLASPVVLGALAVAAVGAAGYYGYKALTKKRLTNLSTARYAQYGFAPSDSDHLQVVFGLEDQLEPAVTWSGAKPEINDKKLDIPELLKSCGVDIDKPSQVEQFMRWFTGRFKPVFLTHLTALKAAGEGKKLSEVESLKVPQKKRYFNLAKFPEGAYDRTDSPFPGGKALVMDARMVGKQLAVTQAELDKEKDTDTAPSLTAGAPVAAAAAATVAATASATATPGATPAAGAGAAAAGRTNTPPALGGTTTITGPAGSMALVRPAGSAIPALDAVRFKTYGLQEMVVEKVRALDLLEAAVEKSTRYSGKGEAYWTGSVSQTALMLGPVFGISGTNNNAAYDWQAWFTDRFLPVWLAYASAVKSAVGKTPSEGAAGLNAQQAVEAALAVYTSQVWGQKPSPWEGYVLSSDSRSVEVNYQALKEAAKKTTLPEQKATAAKGTGSDNGRGLTDGASSQPGLLSRGYDAVKSAAAATWDGAKRAGTMVRNAAAAVSTNAAAVGGMVASGVKAAGSAAADLGGRAVQAVKDGVGGLFDSLPMPAGEGTWASVQALIEKASSMVGVDPKLMATMAAIESGFRPTVKAASSSATGLYQFISSTWKTMLQKYGAKYGIPTDTPATDPRANALMGAEFIKENANALKGVKDNLTDTDLYLAHFMGAGGAKTFLRALASSPDGIAATLMPAAAAANKSIFYEKDGTARSVSAVYAEINRRVRSRGQQFGLNSGSDTPAPGAGAGRGVAPQGTAPEPLTSDQGVSIPVASQTPGVAGAQPAPPVGVTASRPAPASAGIAGFAPPSMPSPSLQAQNTAAQGQAQNADMAQAMGALSTTSGQSLEVHKQQLGVLNSILEVLKQTSSPSSTSSAARSAPQSPPQPLGKPPVSMDKAY